MRIFALPFIILSLADLHPVLAEAGIRQYVNIARFFVTHILKQINNHDYSFKFSCKDSNYF